MFRLKKLKTVLLVAPIFLISGFFLYNNFIAHTTLLSHKSVAVFPFENLSSDAGDEYFVEGMSDEILNRLSKIGELKVISMPSPLPRLATISTTNQLKIEAGLKVQTLLKGSVRKVGDEVQVSAKLINAQTNELLWDKTYNCQLEKIFAVQSEIAEKIAKELSCKLTPSEKQYVEDYPTVNMLAYDQYLLGNEFIKRRASDFFDRDSATVLRDLSTVEHLYRQAFALDSKFIEPMASLIQVFILCVKKNNFDFCLSYSPRARGLLDTMLSLNIDKPFVHFVSGTYKDMIKYDFEGALTEYDKVIKEEPSNHFVYGFRGELLRKMNRFRDAIESFSKSTEFNIDNGVPFFYLYETYSSMRKPEEALQNINKALSMEPYNSIYYCAKANLFFTFYGNVKRAMEVLDSAQIYVPSQDLIHHKMVIQYFSGDYHLFLPQWLSLPDTLVYRENHIQSNLIYIGYTYFLDGNSMKSKKYFDRARMQLEDLIKKSPNDFRLYSELGVAFAGLGNKTLAIANGVKAVNISPVTKDALAGLSPLNRLAFIYTLLGDQTSAIDILEKMLKMPMGLYELNNIPMFKVNPAWKTLHENPRFKKLVGES